MANVERREAGDANDNMHIDKDDIAISSEPQNMNIVKEEYKKLQLAINELGDNVSGVLQKQETEFLSAYRAHMRNVQKDFQDLRDDIDEKEKAITNNIKVKQLEKERDWYKKEALHLDQVLSKTKKREIELSEKVEELEEDRTWLSNQLKLIMKQKNILERKVENENNSLDPEVSKPDSKSKKINQDQIKAENIAR